MIVNRRKWRNHLRLKHIFLTTQEQCFSSWFIPVVLFLTDLAVLSSVQYFLLSPIFLSSFFFFYIAVYQCIVSRRIQQAGRVTDSVVKCRAANSRTTCSEKMISSGCFDPGELHLAAPCPGLSVARFDSERTGSSIPDIILN